MTGLSEMNGSAAADPGTSYSMPDYSSSGVDYSTGGSSSSWLSGIGQLATLGLGVFSTISKADSAAEANKTALDIARTKTAASSSALSYLPMIMIAAVVVLGGVLFLRSRKA